MSFFFSIGRKFTINRRRIKGKAEIIIGKQRNGPTDKVDLAFLDKYTRFENLSGLKEDSYSS